MTTTLTKPKLEFYDFNKLWSMNGVYNFLVGARGLGKTYGAKEFAVRKFLANGDQFIYLRRYDTELRAAKHALFNDLHDAFPDHEFRADGDLLKIRPLAKGVNEETKFKWAICGYALALSKAQQKKSIPYHDVKTIIFDEFIIEKGRVLYLPDEAKLFNDFYSTVDRYKDKTRVLFLANSVSIMNPYFLEYDIKPEVDKEWIRKAKGFIVAHFPDSEAFARGVYETRFGQFIKGTEYADYAVGSFFSDNSKALVRKKSEDAIYHASLITDTGKISIWVDAHDKLTFYIQEKCPKEETIWVMRPEQMEEGRFLVEFNNPILSTMRTAYAQGRTWFDTAQSRNTFAGIYKR
jgi:hypothetical protein